MNADRMVFRARRISPEELKEALVGAQFGRFCSREFCGSARVNLGK